MYKVKCSNVSKQPFTLHADVLLTKCKEGPKRKLDSGQNWNSNQIHISPPFTLLKFLTTIWNLFSINWNNPNHSLALVLDLIAAVSVELGSMYGSG